MLRNDAKKRKNSLRQTDEPRWPKDTEREAVQRPKAEAAHAREFEAYRVIKTSAKQLSRNGGDAWQPEEPTGGTNHRLGEPQVLCG